MNYQLLKDDNFEKAKNYCNKYKINFPYDNQIIIVAIDDQGEIQGISGIKQEWKVEPLISENAIVANNLGRMVEGMILVNGIKKIICTVDKENVKHINQLEKIGFEIKENTKVILEKIYG